jgi:hypothetical protein
MASVNVSLFGNSKVYSRFWMRAVGGSAALLAHTSYRSVSVSSGATSVLVTTMWWEISSFGRQQSGATRVSDVPTGGGTSSSSGSEGFPSFPTLRWPCFCVSPSVTGEGPVLV